MQVTLSFFLLLLSLVANTLSDSTDPRQILNLHKQGKLKVLAGLLPKHISPVWDKLPKYHVQPEHDKLSFSIQLKQCNLDTLRNLLQQQVSNPKHPNYQNYLSKEQLEDAIHCGQHTEHAKLHIPQWLKQNGIHVNQIHVSNSHIHVRHASVRQIERLFSVEMRHFEHKQSGKRLLRAQGLIAMPADISGHVSFINGLTEMMYTNKQPVNADRGMDTAPYYRYSQDFPMVPRVIRKIYNLRSNLTGGLAVNNSLAIAAFDDYFFEEDLCYASEMLGPNAPDGDVYAPPTVVDYHGPPQGSDTGESSLDIQFATLLATNVPTSFWNHEPNKHYGWPEVAHCATTDISDPVLCSASGLDYNSYIETTNTELMKLALMGVTVFVSSGDDGAPGFTIYCPVDPSKPQVFSDEGYPVITCPSSNPNDCKCGSYVLEYEDNGTPIQCFLPQAIGGDVPGQIGGLTLCSLLQDPDAISNIFNAITEWTSIINSTCPTTFDPETFTFGSLCECSSLPNGTFNIVVNNTSNETLSIKLYGYQYQESYAQSIFFSDYPTASPYVVSVGATQIDPFASGDACGQYSKEVFADIRSGAFISGGGGFSVVSSRPKWQMKHVQDYLGKSNALPPLGYFNSSNRGYPDVSFNGHNYAVIVQRRVGFYDGTSASSPSLAGMFALMNEVLLSYGKPPLGLVTPLLYQMAQEEPLAFNKIVPVTHGNNNYSTDNSCTRFYCCKYSFEATTSGWDPVTGLGTPNMEVIENYIRKINNLPSIAAEAATNQPTTKLVVVPTSTPAPDLVSDVPKTVTTTGAVTIGFLCGFSGIVCTILAQRIIRKDYVGYKRQNSGTGKNIELGGSGFDECLAIKIKN